MNKSGSKPFNVKIKKGNNIGSAECDKILHSLKTWQCIIFSLTTEQVYCKLTE